MRKKRKNGRGGWSAERHAEMAEIRAIREEARARVAEASATALRAGMEVMGESLYTFIDRVDEWLAVNDIKRVEFGTRAGCASQQTRQHFWGAFKRRARLVPSWKPSVRTISRIAIALGARLPDLLKPFNDLGSKPSKAKTPRNRATRPAPRSR